MHNTFIEMDMLHVYLLQGLFIDLDVKSKCHHRGESDVRGPVEITAVPSRASVSQEKSDKHIGY